MESMERPEQRGGARFGTHAARHQGDEMCGFNPVELNKDRIYPAGRQPPDFKYKIYMIRSEEPN